MQRIGSLEPRMLSENDTLWNMTKKTIGENWQVKRDGNQTAAHRPLQLEFTEQSNNRR